MNFKEDTKHVGYNQEEIYFYRKDRELIEKLRKARQSPSVSDQQGAKVLEFRPRRDINFKRAA